MLETFFNSVSSVLVIFLLTLTGYYLGASGRMNAEHKGFLSKTLMSFFVPCNCAYGLMNNLNREMLLNSGIYLLIPLATMGCGYLAAWLAAKLFRVEKKHLGLYMLLSVTSNAVFIGLAMCKELFGEEATPYVMLYYIVSNLLLYTVSMSAARITMGGEKVSLLTTLKDVAKMPVVIAAVLGVLLVYLDLRPPHVIMSYLKYMSGAVTPLAMIISGYVIWDIGLSALRMNRETAGVLCFRFLIAPLMCLLFCRIFGAEGLGMRVNLVLSSMPSVTIAVVIAARYGDDRDEMFASQGVAWTSIATFLVTPVLMLLMR